MRFIASEYPEGVIAVSGGQHPPNKIGQHPPDTNGEIPDNYKNG